MSERSIQDLRVSPPNLDTTEAPNPGTNRRKFLGQCGLAAGLAAGTLAAPSVASASGQSEGQGLRVTASPASVAGSPRILEAFELRVAEATTDALLGPARNVHNGDQTLYADHGGTYSKGLAHDQYGRVTPASFASLTKALNSGKFSDFEDIIVGGTRTLNGPQSAYAFDLTGPDNSQFGQPQVPAAPPIAGAISGTELLEHYWAALLRDTNFTDYDTSPLAQTAAAELSSQPSYLGPRNGSGQVTTDLLFRGGFPGETAGPYTSQFFLQPTFFGSQPISQQQKTFLPGQDFGASSFNEWLQIQNGQPTGNSLAFDPQYRYQRNGRDYAAFTHVDVLYQAYFTAFLVLSGLGAPLNPGNPYVHSTTQNGFGTLGAPDFAATIGDIASKALNAVWYQKWLVHMRPRPEATGGQVHLVKTGQNAFTNVIPNATVMNSVGLQTCFNKFGTWLLPMAFPEGSPTHPAYPTGHGTVGGACITIIKFFFDGNQLIQPLLEAHGSTVSVASTDGLALLPYTGADADSLTVNGELNKLGHNVSFGHGFHAGIHWRSDSDTSLLQGEAVALAYLRDKAKTYNEPFSVNLTKFDGTTATISNVGHP
jgi:hypothetical protein